MDAATSADGEVTTQDTGAGSADAGTGDTEDMAVQETDTTGNNALPATEKTTTSAGSTEQKTDKTVEDTQPE